MLTSEQIKQQIILVYGTYTLVENTDYSVVYENNINAGTAKVTITVLPCTLTSVISGIR